MSGNTANPEPAPENNKALTGSPIQSFIHYAIPSIIGILAISSASVVDGIFIGRYEGEAALAAMNLLIPVFSIVFGVAYMLAIGGSVSAGKYIGENHLQAASNIFSKTLIAALVFSLLFLALGLSSSEVLYAALGAKPELYPIMAEYFELLLLFFPSQAATVVMYFFVRIAGHPRLASIALVSSAVANLLLDWLFIGIWHWGMFGAALATGLAQLASLLSLLCYFFMRHRPIVFRPWQKNWAELARSSFNGLSEFVNEISAGIVAYVLNLLIIKQLGVQGVAAFSVVSYTMFIGLLLAFSIADTLQTLGSQCYGAKNTQRLRQFIRIACSGVSISGLLFIALLLSQGEKLIAIFIVDGDTQLIATAKSFIQILWPVFIFNGLNVCLSAYLTSIHRASASATIALMRSLILPLSLLALLVNFFPQLPLLWAMTCAEGLTLLIALGLFYRFRPSAVLTHN